jgi:GDP-4-dehydro-6-deoxy-D-mannose reductase
VRILVTGAGGFAGRHLCSYLASIDDDTIPCSGPDGLGALDVTDGEAVQRRIAEMRPEGIVHLAGVSSVGWSHSHPAKTFLVNALGTLHVLQAMRNAVPDARLLVVGSGEMYGRVLEGARASEEDALRPLSPYAASKCAAELIARQYAASYGTQAIFVRPFNHLGAGQAPQFVVPSFARQIAEVLAGKREPVIDVGDLSPVRDFLHVQDVVYAYRLLLEKGESGASYNVSSGEPLAIRGLLDRLLEISGLSVKVRVDPDRLRPVEIPWLVGDSSTLRSLGWRPKHTVHSALEEALQEAVSR